MIYCQYFQYKSCYIIFYYQPPMQGDKGQAPKVRKDKRKNTETGLLMGQNTNIFSQLSATYLQTKPSTTEEQLSFVKQTQIIEYHDPKINRLISLLRKKADVTKSKAAQELREEVVKMTEQNISEFMQTFAHLFMEIIVNEQSKQTVDEFVNMMNHVLTHYKKIAIKEIATIFAPLLVINRSYNLSQQKIYSMLFNGTDEQIHEKAIILLLTKNVTKKFLHFCRVIIECQEAHKIGEQNFQRNCSYLLKVLKQLIRSYNGISSQKKQQLAELFSSFMGQVNEIVSSKFAQDYFRAGGRAKSSFLQFYQVLISQVVKHPEWNIQWEAYAKIICQNYLDKDQLVQQSLWKYCNKQFIESTLEIEKMEMEQEDEIGQQKQKQKYRIFYKYLPKPEEKLLSALKLGGVTLYKQLPSYCLVFPHTTLSPAQNHKTIVNKISFMRKLMQSLLELEDENEARIQCYHRLVVHLLGELRKILEHQHEGEEKKFQQIKSLSLKAQKQFINNLQDFYYKNPALSRNSFSYNIPSYFCRILVETQPSFDFLFDKKQTFPLYSPLASACDSEYCNQLFDKIFEHCRQDMSLMVDYLENFPSRSIQIDMSENNENVEQASKIFLLSKEALQKQNWFRPEWDSRKKLICFDPRLSWAELSKYLQQEPHQILKVSSKHIPKQDAYIQTKHDGIRFNYFLKCLQSQDQIGLITCMVPLIKDILLQRNQQNRAEWVTRILQLNCENVERLQKKQWVVSHSSVLRLRVTCDIVFEALKKTGFNPSEVDRSKLLMFGENYCLFALTLYNYKLETDSEELLKLMPKVLIFDFISQSLFKSVIDTMKFAYDAYAKNLSMTSGHVEERQRKNRLTRLVNFVRKLLWYGIDKKKQSLPVELLKQLLLYQDWKYAELRADLWMLIEVVLEALDFRVMQKIIRHLLVDFQSNSHFLALLLSSHLILPLQRHLTTKKVILQLQAEVFKQIKQNFSHDQNCQLLHVMISEATLSESFLLINGAKKLLKNSMKNYQQMSRQSLQQYEFECLGKPLENLIGSESSKFNKNCFLLRSIFIQLPLLDFPNILEISGKLSRAAELQKEPLKKLGYLGLQASFWQLGVEVSRLTPQATNQIVLEYVSCLKQLVTQMRHDDANFARYYGLIFLNSFLTIKSKELLKDYWQFLLKEIILPKVEQGIPLHSEIQTARFALISRIFNISTSQLQNELVDTIPNEILMEVKLYKEVLDMIDDDQQEEQLDLSTRGYENTLNIFIECAEVLVRITGSLTKQVKPKQEVILQLLQCPFAGIKKTAFLLLKQMYQLKLVDPMPPAIFLSYLKMNPQVIKKQIEPMVANLISGYLYSWQAIIERREVTESSNSQQQNNLSLEDYLQNENLLELFLKNIFEVIETQLEYSHNQSELQITVQQLMETDSLVIFEDDFKLYQKVFRLIVRTLFMFIENFPYFLRDFVDRNKKFRPVCDRLLRNVISDAIFQQEITRIEMREHEWKSAGNFEIYVTAKNKQIYAEYTHDVIRIGLRVAMKSNYPITPLSIEFGEGLKIEEGSRWALMLQSQLHNRNNTIIKGILLWKDNIDKKLGGVEECAICFDIVNSSGQLPRKGCKTCKKKFHSVCIMKWFNKSNKSECPLCKSQFL